MNEIDKFEICSKYRREDFDFDEIQRQRNNPINVAGCPPDGFSATGQLWGNPLYNWKYMKQDGYSWWLKRLEAASKLYDVVRIDHFRGFESYYSIPYGEETALNGKIFFTTGSGNALS